MFRNHRVFFQAPASCSPQVVSLPLPPFLASCRWSSWTGWPAWARSHWVQPGLRSALIGCGRERSQWGEGSGQISSRAGEGWLLACPPGPDPSRASGSPEHPSGVWASQAAGSNRERGRREAGQLLTDNGFTTPRGGKRKQRIDSLFYFATCGLLGRSAGETLRGSWRELLFQGTQRL